jgi:single-strand DNA-binding protein
MQRRAGRFTVNPRGAHDSAADATHSKTHPEDEEHIMSNTYLNKVCLIGNSGGDATRRHTREGICVTNISIAVKHPKRTEPTWMKLTFWGRQAEYVADRVGKGSGLYVEGELDIRTWEDEACVQRTETVVHVRELQVLSYKEPRCAAPAPTEEPVVEQQMAPTPDPAGAFEDDEQVATPAAAPKKRAANRKRELEAA